MATENQQDDIAFLVKEVKKLRKERADLLRRLTQAQEMPDLSSDNQLPLTELSRMADGIVHDMGNGIGIIRNTIGAMRDALVDTPQEVNVQKILRSLDFCELVMRNLSAIGGRDFMNLEYVNLEKTAREMFFMLGSKLVNVQLKIERDAEDPVILADEGHMKQVFMNLIKNAGEAMPKGGILTCRFHRDGKKMRVEVQDTGNGISENIQPHLFRKFFTTKERGYGLGLFIVRTIVERHSGEISVKSKIGEGTIFTILLPIED